jgi:hypothetical protein
MFRPYLVNLRQLFTFRNRHTALVLKPKYFNAADNIRMLKSVSRGFLQEVRGCYESDVVPEWLRYIAAQETQLSDERSAWLVSCFQMGSLINLNIQVKYNWIHHVFLK